MNGAECGGHHLEVVEEELALADHCLHIRQTWSAGGEWGSAVLGTMTKRQVLSAARPGVVHPALRLRDLA